MQHLYYEINKKIQQNYEHLITEKPTTTKNNRQWTTNLMRYTGMTSIVQQCVVMTSQITSPV